MSKISKAVGSNKSDNLRKDEIVTNFMGGDSYVINPLYTLKMVTASSIFGEASYYRNGSFGGKKVNDGFFRINELLKNEDILFKDLEEKTTTEIMETTIDNALDFDFKATLDWAVELRNTYNMRLNPQVIMVRAAIHPKREQFTKAYPGQFLAYQMQVMQRADEPSAQVAYYLYKNGKKNNMPTILKRSLSGKLSKLSAYEVAKYKNHEIGIIDAVRITHASSPVLSSLMKGELKVEENQKTWENLRSQGKSWKEIFEQINMGHMALLRNLRGVFTEVDDVEFCKRYLDKLKAGVLTGKQFPYRYYSAIKAVKDSGCNHSSMIITALEECLDISTQNLPKMNGKTMCLSDNSGSAWGTIPSEYGSVTIAEIGNLSSFITASCSDDGYVGKFGDRLKVFPVNKRNGLLSQSQKASKNNYNDVGGSTEGGIWEFFKKAINDKEHWDNIFIYSDQQAGHGGLYGTYAQSMEYEKLYGVTHGNINVYKLILDYRAKVNPKVNVFCVQTAGYNNVLVPEMAYRVAITYGWTGKEQLYAKAMNDLWDEIDKI